MQKAKGTDNPTPQFKFPPKISEDELARLKDNARLFFLCAYAPLHCMSQHCADDWGYVLLSHGGHLVQMYGSEAFKQGCRRRGLDKGSCLAGPEAGPNAVAAGLAGVRNAASHGSSHTCASLQDVGLYFHPVFLDAQNLQNEFYGFKAARICENPNADERDAHIVGLYGGVAIVTLGQPFQPLYAIMAEATAREVNMQIYWFNVSIRNMMPNIGFISVNQETKSNQVMMLSSGIYEMFNLPMRDYHLRQLREVIDPLPENEAFWQILNDRKLVHDYGMTLTSHGTALDVRIHTRCSTEKKFMMHEMVVWVQAMGPARKAGKRCGGNVARAHFSDIIAHAPAQQQLLREAEIASLTSSSILILGESGTGKDILAQAIHNNSPRKHQPFVAVNCASFSKELIASELFGYEPGAFTGAHKAGAIGKFQLADGGTLFLDEIGDMPLDIQATLLRAIEQKSFMKVGGNNMVDVDVRIIAATNKNLQEKIEAGLFREDLFYRLGVVRLVVPPLRERPEDVLPLAGHFLGRIQLRANKPVTLLSDEAKAYMGRYFWPGNVRELQNLLEGITSITAAPVIECGHIRAYLEGDPFARRALLSDMDAPPAPAEEDSAPASGRPRRLSARPSGKLTREAVERALEKNSYNCVQTAQELGISRRTLYRRLEEYKLMR